MIVLLPMGRAFAPLRLAEFPASGTTAAHAAMQHRRHAGTTAGPGVRTIPCAAGRIRYNAAHERHMDKFAQI
jgi:hypothetical protein